MQRSPTSKGCMTKMKTRESNNALMVLPNKKTHGRSKDARKMATGAGGKPMTRSQMRGAIIITTAIPSLLTCSMFFRLSSNTKAKFLCSL